MPKESKPKQALKQIDLKTLEELVKKIEALRGGEPLMTRDPYNEYVTIKNKLKITV